MTVLNRSRVDGIGAPLVEPWNVLWTPPPILMMEEWLLRLPVGRPVVIISPHADDAEIATGALIRWLADQGVPVVVILLYPGYRSSGELHGLKSRDATARRLLENRESCRITGAEFLYLGLVAAYERANYQPDYAEVQKLSRAIQRLNSAVVLVPPRHDPHVAHQAARATVAEALKVLRGACPHIVTYDAAWGGLGGENAPNLVFPFGAALAATKRSAIRAFKTQLQPTDILSIAEEMGRLPALRLPELLAGHHSVGRRACEGMVGCELYRHEVLDPSRAKGPWADPIHVALMALEDRSTEGVDDADATASS